jgi:glycine dehydrogenase subunit 1
MNEHAEANSRYLSFLGAGAYDHHIPAAVWQLASRGEFYTSYTPYQAEASQGTLQLVYEWQTMMASLTGMDVSNASLYDGATAFAEAVLMSVRANRNDVPRALVPSSLHPHYRATLKTIVGQQGIAVVEIPFDRKSGRVDQDALEVAAAEPFAVLAIAQPNFFGVLEEPDALTDWAHGRNALVIGVSNPMALALVKPAGEWGSAGADIACGDAQPFGIPLSGGGPYLGYLCCKQALVRQMPGRIVGATVDLDGQPGYTLTLQAREQHIRRAKATSNICTNQGLMVTASAIYLSLLGPKGLESAAATSHASCRKLVEKLGAIPGVEPVFDSPFFHEAVIRLPVLVVGVLEKLLQQKVLGGLDVAHYYPELGNALLLCVTENKTSDDLDRFANALATAIKESPC